MSNRRRNDEASGSHPWRCGSWPPFLPGIIGLCFVYLTTQIHGTGRQIHDMEIELKDLIGRNEAAHAKISRLSSRTVLQRRLVRLIKMQPITDEHIVRIAAKRPSHQTKPAWSPTGGLAMKIGPKRRGMIACVLMAGCFTGFSARLIYIRSSGTITTAGLPPTTAWEQVIPATRGLIQDINHEVLADNEPVHCVIADGSLIKKPAEIAKLLTKPLEMNASANWRKAHGNHDRPETVVLKNKFPHPSRTN